MAVIKSPIALVLAFMSIIVVTRQNNTATSGTKELECTMRLSPNVRPIQYVINIEFNSDMENSTYSGTVEITIVLTIPQCKIVLHSKELTIIETLLDSKPVKAFAYDKYDFWILDLGEEICAGTHKILLKFNRCLSNGLGFYQSSYTDNTAGKERLIVSTYFKPILARSAFPCFDEPNMRSKFKITITRPCGDNYIALSNMKQECEEPVVPTNGLINVKFANSELMSSYLVSFFVGDFQLANTVQTSRGVTIQIFSRRGIAKQSTEYASTVASKAFDYFEDYFRIDYPLSKLDILAIPDYSANFMEHWGLICYYENNLYYEDCKFTIRQKESVTTLISLELSSMWMGNLVTMIWWDESWLFDAFSKFMALKAVEVIQPQWVTNIMFPYNLFITVLDSDSKSHAIAIARDVSSLNDIYDLQYDNDSSNKGACLLRMLEGILGKVTFNIGIMSYIKKFQYCNTHMDDLWNELKSATLNTVDVKRIMYPWIKQAGYPVITAMLDGNILTLKQERFLTDANSTSSLVVSPYEYKWDLFIKYITSNCSTIKEIWMCREQALVTIDLPGIEWIKINYQFMGFYIVNYSYNNWCALGNLLQKNVNALCAADRANLLYDAFRLAESSYISYIIPLDLTKYIVCDTHFLPWFVVSKSLNKLQQLLYCRPVYSQLEKYCQQLLGCLKEDTLDLVSVQEYWQYKYRLQLYDFGGLYGAPMYKTKIIFLFKQLLYQNITVNIDIKNYVLNYGIKYGDANDFNKLWELYQCEKNPNEKPILLRALLYSQDLSLLAKLFQYGLNGDCISKNDLITLIKVAAKMPVANTVAWNFVRKEWQSLIKITGPELYGYITFRVCRIFNTQQQVDEMVAFFNNHTDIFIEPDKQTVIQRVLNNIKWLEKNEPVITKWLSNCSD